jgi:uncharacterized protein YceH (UPF0502 family)
MLRGTQTPGELRARTERMHRFADAAELQAALDGLAARELVIRLDRRPGQKEERYAHRLGEDAPDAAPLAPPAPSSPAAAPPAPAPSPPPRAAPSRDDERVAALEHDLAELRSAVASLRAEVATLRDALGG